jgi:hypothetical protein
MVNARGMTLINRWLRENSKRPPVNAEQLRAWAMEAERALDICGQPIIELRAWESRSGHTETFTIPPSGITQ